MNFVLFMTNTYIFAISCYTEMNERKMVITIRDKRNETVYLERAIIDVAALVEL